MNNLKSGFFTNHPVFILKHNTLDILDANICAVNTYGFSHKELCAMNINDLGKKKKRSELVSTDVKDDNSADKIWIQKTKDGQEFYAQFTSHIFNNMGDRVKLAVVHNVTEQVERAEKNPNNYPQLQNFERGNTLAEIIWNGDKLVQNWSEKAQELFGWSEDEAVGNTEFMDRFVPDSELKAACDKFDEAIENMQTSYQVNGRVVDKSGNIRICEWHNSIVYDVNDNVSAIYSLVQDITERKESEILFEALSEESLVGIYLIQDGVFKYVNPKFCEIFSYSKKEIEHKISPADLTFPEDRPIVNENIRKRLDEEAESIEYDFRGITKEGKMKHVQVFGRRIEYLGKSAIIGTLLDVSQSKLAFKRYQASVDSFENLFDSISDAIYIQDKAGRFIKMNEAAVQLNGYSRNELIGEKPSMLAAPGKTDLEATAEYFEKALQGEPQEFEQWGIRKNGEVFPEHVALNPGHYLGSEVVIAISRDISHRFEIEEQIQQSEEMFWQLFQNSPMGIAMLDKNQDIRMVNPSFEQMFGYVCEEIEGLDINHLIVPEDDFKQANDISNEIFKGKTSSITAKRKRKDETLLDVLIYGVPVKLHGRTIAIFGIYVDISEQSEYEHQIEKSLKEKEVMLAEIHHRVKNNLAVITGLLELQQYKSKSEAAKSILRESQLRINSIALIHEKLYQNEDLTEIPIDIYLRELIDIIAQSMESEAIEITINIQSETTFLNINQAIPCGLILNELTTNAYKHAFNNRSEGEIKITLNNDKNRFNLIFEDDGVGIPDTVNFENPSTLGLTLIQTLSKQLNGTHEFENRQHGICFTLQFKIDE